MKKNSLDMAYLYQAVDTWKGAVCINKACIDEFHEVIQH